VGLFLQARLGSTRLPRKALLPLGGATVLQLAMRALARVPAGVRALLTEPASEGTFAGLAKEEGFELFVGSEEDVLDRFCRAAARFGVQRVVRATGDNPLVSPAQVRSLLELHQGSGWQLSHYLGPPLGTGVEVVEASALAEAGEKAADPYEREHVTPYLYRHPERFRVGEPSCPAAWHMPEARLTLDTAADYELLRELFGELYRGQPLETEELVRWLREPRERR
jgi:spore coat polysaccharide biosynthesis protein SpsF